MKLKKAGVTGNYEIQNSFDSPSLIINNNGDFIIDGGYILPYEIK